MRKSLKVQDFSMNQNQQERRGTAQHGPEDTEIYGTARLPTPQTLTLRGDLAGGLQPPVPPLLKLGSASQTLLVWKPSWIP